MLRCNIIYIRVAPLEESTMKIIEPTHKEIMQFLDCCYYSRWHKGQCECHSPHQFKDCYERAIRQLTRYEYTDEEIKQGQEANAKAMLDIERALAIFHGEEELQK